MPKPSEVMSLVATIDPDANAASSYTTDYVDMEFWGGIYAIVYAGILGGTGTLNAKLLQATSSTGAGAATIVGKSITALTTASNDKQAVIELQPDELDVAGGFKFVALRVISVATSDWGAAVYGVFPRFGPASANDLASVAQIVA